MDNVDQYIGGIEHAVMHLLYARFFTKFLRDQDMLDENEPFERLLTLGMVNHPAYNCPEHGWLYPEEVEDENICEKCGQEVEVNVMKMSKSKHNVVDPTELVEEHGADTARVFILRASGPTNELDWSEDGVEAAEQMLERVERLVENNEETLTDQRPSLEDGQLYDRIMASRIQRAIEKVTEDTENYDFNLAIDELDRLLSKLYWYEQQGGKDEVLSNGIKTLLKLLSPYAPHITEELWDRIGNENFMLEEDWPEVDEELIDEEAEKINAYFDSVSSDIREIIEMINDEPETVKIITASNWKYEAGEKILGSINETKDVGKMMDKVLDENLQKYAQEINEEVVKAVENPGKYRRDFTGKDLEEKALELNEKRFEDEFNVEIIVETEENSAEDKASRAQPGRPAIVVE